MQHTFHTNQTVRKQFYVENYIQGKYSHTISVYEQFKDENELRYSTFTHPTRKSLKCSYILAPLMPP